MDALIGFYAVPPSLIYSSYYCCSLDCPLFNALIHPLALYRVETHRSTGYAAF